MGNEWKIVEGDRITVNGVTGRVFRVTEPENPWEPTKYEMLVEDDEALRVRRWGADA